MLFLNTSLTGVSHVIGPVLTLSLAGIANLRALCARRNPRNPRAGLCARGASKGLHEKAVLFVRALRNALLPMSPRLGSKTSRVDRGWLVHALDPPLNTTAR